jgi:hypothetical protein
VPYEPIRFRGSFEFHGEEGYTDAVTSAPHEYTALFPRLVCPGRGSGEIRGGSLPGARLLLRQHDGSTARRLQANRNHPGGRTRVEVHLREKRGAIAISREIILWSGPTAFGFDRNLRSATLSPPAPFSGRASFQRAGAAWGGDLSVDLPGRSDVPLTDSGIAATLSHACFQGEGAGSRADCGFR